MFFLHILMISQKTKTVHHDLGAVVLSIAFRCGSVRDFLRLLMISFVPRSLSFTLKKIGVKLTSFDGDCASQRNCILLEKNIRFGFGKG